MNEQQSGSTRRDFLKTTAVLGAGAMISPLASGRGFAGGSDTLRVGLIGCGGRGTGAAVNCFESSPGVRLVAMADAFEDRLNSSAGHLTEKLGDSFDVPPERRYVGYDAYQKLIREAQVDLVILATPPGFRPDHLTAAVDAGLHVFMEKPVAVDPVGVRKVIAAAKKAKAQSTGIVAGTQRRHQASYIETMKRIHDGAIGELVGGQCYWNQGGLWFKEHKPEWTDLEWQVRNWLYFPWLSGDHIVEQHIHNLDVMNWAFGSPPAKVMGMGGRQVRTGKEYGCIFDHFAVELEYPGGQRCMSMCRQIDGTASRVAERLVGTRGTSNPNGRIFGPAEYRYRGKARGPYVQEHTDLIDSIRAGEPLNEGVRVAESTLTAIMGRMSAYTGKAVSWDFAMKSELDLTPPESAYHNGELAVAAVATPGQTPLI